MSEESDRLISQIAELLKNGESDEVAGLRQAVENINRRLDRIEGLIESPRQEKADTGPSTTHPSIRRFNITDIVEAGEMAAADAEKACPYEPAGKPCDHCAMCSSLGF